MKKILDYIEDLLILAGLFFIILATFRMSVTAGIYSIGLALLSLGAFLAKYPPGRKR